MSSEASTLLGLLADDDRLRTVAALVLGSVPATVSEVAPPPASTCAERRKH